MKQNGASIEERRPHIVCKYLYIEMASFLYNGLVFSGAERRYALFGAQEGTRTPTTLRSPAPEAGASTNFATWACRYYKGMRLLAHLLICFRLSPFRLDGLIQ